MDELAGRVGRFWRARWTLLGLIALWCLLVGVGAGTGGLAGEVGDCRDLSVLQLEVAGSSDRLSTLLERCADPAAPAGTAPTQEQLDGIRSGLNHDSWLFVPVYVVLLGFWSVVALQQQLPRTRASRGLLSLGICAAFLAGAFDLLENLALHRALDDPASTTWPVLAFAAAVPKFVLVACSATAALGGLRLVLRQLRRPVDPINGNYYRARGTRAQDRAFDIPDRPGPDAVGIACSGGGIRSGTFCMGAVQSFTERLWPGTETRIIHRVDRITSVSGGGYFAGAHQMLAHDGVPLPFRAGSLEEDHVRRHGRYLADSPAEWLVAVARIVAGLVLNLGLVVLLLFVLARPVGWAQKQLGTCELVEVAVAAPVADAEDPPTVDEAPPAPQECIRGALGLEPQHWAAPALAAGLALVLLVAFALFGETGDTGRSFSRGDVLLRASGAAAVAALGAATLTVLVPGVSRALRVLLDLVGGTTGGSLDLVGTVTTSGTANLADTRGVAVGAGTIFALTATALRLAVRRAGAATRLVRRVGADDAEVHEPGRILRLAQRLAGAALAICALVLVAGFVEDAQRGPTAESWFGWEDLHIWAVLVAALILLSLADQTSWSLHSLYRRRLSTAFALRRLGGEIRERPYSTPTRLSELAAPAPDLPKLVVCAAANLSGNDIAPPGRRAVSFTFEHDWIGSPQLGYLASEDYENCMPRAMSADTTLLAAMAISGAAVASAMGRHSKGALQCLLALFNVRLGVWLPTPEFADDVRRKQERATRRRGFTFLLREIFGSYDSGGAFTYVSDGGHYENLGLVELLRRRCSVILCLDASGGPATLVEALRLAETELGISVELSEEDLLSVRARPADDDDESALAGRVAGSSTLTARIHYPAVTGIGPDMAGVTEVAAQEGWLVYGRAVLTDDTPPTVAEHAWGNPRFPNDPTGDQWFDADQFDNYLILGRHVGDRMADALEAIAPPPD